MLNFRKLDLSDIELFKKYNGENGEFSCEHTFLTLFIWRKWYQNMIATKGDTIYIKFGDGKNESFCLPFGSKDACDIYDIFEYCKDKKPVFWAQEGQSFDLFKPVLEKEGYCFFENRDSFDYIYERDSLASLSGKKYHSKRNHIAAFSKKYNWRYESLGAGNIEKVRECASLWYASKEPLGHGFLLEKESLFKILDNFNIFKNIKGGVIFVDDNAVAFTLGSAVNGDVFDINIEKALPDFATAYSVINREFALKELSGFKYINREDDLGIEGLRKAKLSYSPERLIKKCTVKASETLSAKEQCRMIYRNSFCDDSQYFEEVLFKKCWKSAKYICEKDEVVSCLFALLCELTEGENSRTGTYIYAAATKESHRGKGYMTRLLKEVLEETNGFAVLRPANEKLCDFYAPFGFETVEAKNSKEGAPLLSPLAEYAELSQIFSPKADGKLFTLMFNGKDKPSKIYFTDSLE